jgi:hypothetical protein
LSPYTVFMRLRVSAFGTFVLLSAGCSANVVDDGEAGEIAEATTHGSVSVERTASLGGPAGAGEVQSHVSARFMRISGNLDPELAERMVGAPKALPGAGTCDWLEIAGAAPLPPNAADGSIELLDVGDILLHAEAHTTQLAARAFPDVGDIVSGVVYTSRDGTSGIADGHTYLIETTGSDFVDGFSMRVEAPMVPTGIVVEQFALDSETADSAKDGLQLRWHAGNPKAGDQIYVDISGALTTGETASTDEASRTLRCTFTDSGTAQIPARFAAGLPDGELDIALHRLRRTIIGLTAIDEAVVDFDFAVTTRVAGSSTP